MEEVKDRSGRTGGRAGRRENLVLEQVYDETIYIEGAIDLVAEHLDRRASGRTRPAAVPALAARDAGDQPCDPGVHRGDLRGDGGDGRTLNVISLAGIAFAIGMIVDAAIVVLENIYRLREQGMSRREAAYQGRNRSGARSSSRR
jgi:HAE1 family hydrophobic/amphiphilic exporter-1